MDLDLPRLHGIVPPLPTPFDDEEAIDVASLERLVEFQIAAGVHGLWILGTTGRFDLVTDPAQRTVAETAIQTAAGRVPMVLNVSDMGTTRTLARARMFDDLPYDYYAALPPWYQPMTRPEILDYFTALADELSRPLVIYNAPWINNQLTFQELRTLAEHPRIVGCKDVGPWLTRTLEWPASERRQQDFTYLHGNDNIAQSTDAGADGFVTSLANAFPELCVATWEATRLDDAERAFRLQAQLTRLTRMFGFGPALACLEAACRHRGLFQRMLPRPLQSFDEATAQLVADVLDTVGVLPDHLAEARSESSAS